MNQHRFEIGSFLRWLPAPVAIVIAGVSIYLWQALSEREARHLHKAVSAQVTEVEKTLSGHVDAEIFSLVRMAKH